MEKVKTKLAAWSWDNEEAEHHPLPRSQDTRVRCASGEEGAPAPPNTAASKSPSLQRSLGKNGPRTSYWQASPPSPELTSPPIVGFPECKDTAISNIARQLSSVTLQDKWLKTHRDSVSLAHHRLDGQKHYKTNAQLASTQDSFVLTKSHFDRYPKSHLQTDPYTGKITFGGLSPIMDASPPDAKIHHEVKRDRRENTSLETVIGPEPGIHRTAEIGGHPDGDDGCPICDVERPRSSRAAHANQ